MSVANLDTGTLRTLIVAIDLGGYGRAAGRLGRTPSAISLQMKRLQQDVGAVMFRREGRSLALTEVGEIVLRFGRRMLELNDELLDTVRGAALAGNVRLGFSQDFAEGILPAVLSQFSRLYPLIQMEVRIEGNAALVEAVDNGHLDLALVVGHGDRATAQMLGELKLVWVAGEDFVRRTDRQLPLVALGPQCAFRMEAIQKLDQAGIPWRIAAVSPSLSGLWAAATGGLGVTVRTEFGIPGRLVSGRNLFGLPGLGSFSLTLHRRKQNTSAGLERLASIIIGVARACLPLRTDAPAPPSVSRKRRKQ